ncbi:MAG: type II secretion system minor pseudopilin GspJ [Gammaproteobacteria bacterium]
MASSFTQQSGFTLLELLISSIIFAIMAIMAYGGLDNVIQNSKSSQQALKRLQQVQRSVAVLDRDFSQIVQRSIRDEYGVTQPYLFSGKNIDDLVEFTRGGRVNPANLVRSSLLRVTYRFDDETLVRLQWPQLDRAQGIKPKKTTIIDGVEKVTIRFLDEKGQWRTQWPPLNSASTGQQGSKPKRPSAIEIVLQLNDWGDIRRLYALN